MEQGLKCFRSYLLPLLFILMISRLSGQTPVAVHGQLSITDSKMYDKNGQEYQLRGMSLFWSNWLGKYWNYETVKWLRDDWHCNVIRAAMGVSPDDNSGYLGNPEIEKKKMITIIEAAIDLGIYVVVDWHSHKAQNTAETEAAKIFFAEIAQKYGSYPNILYETYNEPAVGWSEIKSYHEAVIPEIRKFDSKNIIILGTPTYSQDIGVAVNDPVAGSNLCYAFHYYAASHDFLQGNISPVVNAKKLVFVSEFGTCEYTGSGELDKDASNVWWSILDNNMISWANWAVSDAVETAAIVLPGSSVIGGWADADLTESGRFVRAKLRSYPQDPIPTGIKPYITSSPMNASVPDQSSANFTVEAVGGGTMSYKWFFNDVEIPNSNTATYTVPVASEATSGDYHVEITNSVGTTVSKIATLGVRYRSLFYATPLSVPGIIQFEDYDKGGQNIGYYDTGYGNSGKAYRADDADIELIKDKTNEYSIGFTDAGEWLAYTVDVAWAGEFEIDVYFAANAAGGEFSVSMDNTDIVPLSAVPSSGGWFTYGKMTKKVTLTEGEHLLKFNIIKAGFNIDYMEFRSLVSPEIAPIFTAQPKSTDARIGKPVFIYATATGAQTISYQWFLNGLPIVGATDATLEISSVSEADAGKYTVKATNHLGTATSLSATLTVLTSMAYGGVPVQLPGRVLFKNFDEGANGESYMDDTPGNESTTASVYRTSDVDLEDCTDGGSGHSIGYVTSGEWLNYSVSIKFTGTYTVGFRVATASTGVPTLVLSVDGKQAVGGVGVDNTGGWDKWATVTRTVDLVAGNHVLQIKANQGDFNMNYMDFDISLNTQKIDLATGWNLISLTLDPGTKSIESIFGKINGLIIKTSDQFYRQDQAEFLNTLTQIVPGVGYAVYNPGSALAIDLEGLEAGVEPSTAGLTSGWHLVAAGAVGNDLTVFGSTVSEIKDVESFYMYADGAGTLTGLNPGKAYFVKVK